jgi:hypothetical protein
MEAAGLMRAGRELRFTRGPDRDRRRVYTAPTRLSLNQWALTGEWTIRNQSAALASLDGRIVHRFHARDVIGQPKPIADRTFEIEFPDAGWRHSRFTFG